MKRIVYYTMSICLGLLILSFIEAVVTYGSAFDFEHYSTFGWIIQGVGVLFTITLSAHIAGKEELR